MYRYDSVQFLIIDYTLLAGSLQGLPTILPRDNHPWSRQQEARVFTLLKKDGLQTRLLDSHITSVIAEHPLMRQVSNSGRWES